MEKDIETRIKKLVMKSRIGTTCSGFISPTVTCNIEKIERFSRAEKSKNS